MDKEKDNIIMIGAGLTGLAFCNLLKNTNLNISLVDMQPKSFYKKIDNNRYIVLSNTSKIIFDSLGLWSKINTHCTKVKNIHISKKNIFGSTIVKSKDENLDSLGYQISIKELIKILYENIEKEKNIKFIHQAKVMNAKQSNGVKVKYIKNSIEKIITSDAVIFSTGSSEDIISEIFLDKVQKDYQQNAITCELVSDIYNSETAFERFTNKGIIGLIPRKENSWTLIYSTNKEETELINKLEETGLKNYFQDLMGKKCGNIKNIKNIKTYPLKMKYYKNCAKDNMCLLGDAAHTLHPIAAQSFNLSLRDCTQLTEIIKKSNLKNKDNFSAIFKDYYEKREREVNRLLKFTDYLASLIHGKGFFRNNLLGVSFLIMDMNKSLRVNVIRYLLGVNFSHSLISNLKE